MLTFFFFALPFIILAGLFWLVTLPLRLLFGFIFGGIFRLAFGLFGALIGLLLAPFVLLIVGAALAVAFVVGMFALLAPLMPFVVLGLIGWGIYRLMHPRLA